MTNSGTCFVTNADFFVYNDMATEFGALVNLPGGVMNLINSDFLSSIGAFATVANQGTINATNGTSYINVGSGLLTGAYNAPAGTIVNSRPAPVLARARARG